jgi:glutamate racemase
VGQETIDGIVLGCTHYPFVKGMIREIVGDNVTIYDGGPGTAREMKRRLREQGLENDRASAGKVHFLNSRDTKEEMELCQKLFHMPEK